MTPKEYADKLVNDYYNMVYPNTGIAIEGVKFLIDEVLIFCKDDLKDYVNQVKKELENL